VPNDLTPEMIKTHLTCQGDSLNLDEVDQLDDINGFN